MKIRLKQFIWNFWIGYFNRKNIKKYFTWTWFIIKDEIAKINGKNRIFIRFLIRCNNKHLKLIFEKQANILRLKMFTVLWNF